MSAANCSWCGVLLPGDRGTEAATLRAEIEALRADLDRLTRGGWSKELARLSAQNAELRAEAEALRSAVDRALAQISGGLCYFTAEAKHVQLRDAQQTLLATKTKEQG